MGILPWEGSHKKLWYWPRPDLKTCTLLLPALLLGKRHGVTERSDGYAFTSARRIVPHSVFVTLSYFHPKNA